jgi:hypothetical protein
MALGSAGKNKFVSSTTATSQQSFAAGRLPILLQVTDATLAAGPVGQPLPLHVQPLLSEPTGSSGEALYGHLADPLTSLFHRLLGTKVAASGVIVLHSHGIYPNEGWKLAISRLLNDLLKVTKVCFFSTLHTLPALISHSHSVLAVHFVVSSAQHQQKRQEEVQCMITAVDHDPLEYTFHSVALPHNRRGTSNRTMTTDGGIRNDDDDNNNKEQEALYGAVVRAMCLSLLACPRSHRKSALQNIIVVQDDDEESDGAATTTTTTHATKIARQLHEYLTTTNDDDDDDRARRLPRSDQDNDVHGPIRRDELKALAPYIGLVQFQSSFRLPYLGASVLISSSTRHNADLLPWQDITGI